MFLNPLNSIARPKFHIERGLASCPASPAPQRPLEPPKARVAGPSPQQRDIRHNCLVPAGLTARAHPVKGTQIREIARSYNVHNSTISRLTA
jgi:hypothetical protein